MNYFEIIGNTDEPSPSVINEIQKMDNDYRKNLIAKLKEIEGLSIRQIVRLTGVRKYYG